MRNWPVKLVRTSRAVRVRTKVFQPQVQCCLIPCFPNKRLERVIMDQQKKKTLSHSKIRFVPCTAERGHVWCRVSVWWGAPLRSGAPLWWTHEESWLIAQRSGPLLIPQGLVSLRASQCFLGGGMGRFAIERSSEPSLRQVGFLTYKMLQVSKLSKTDFCFHCQKHRNLAKTWYNI